MSGGEERRDAQESALDERFVETRRQAVARRHPNGVPAVTSAALAEELRINRRAERQALAVQRVLVQELRSRGASWTAIGHALGTSRQNARQRFGGEELV